MKFSFGPTVALLLRSFRAADFVIQPIGADHTWPLADE
jgi:hypothetical protein